MSTKAGGGCVATPDVCLTASGAPLACVNQADCRNAVSTSDRVCVQNKDVLVEMSLIPFSVGAPPNATAGVVSGVVNQMCRFSTASEKVFAEGQRVIIHTSVTSQNGSVANAIGCQVAPSQSVVMARS